MTALLKLAKLVVDIVFLLATLAVLVGMAAVVVMVLTASVEVLYVVARWTWQLIEGGG